MKYRKSNLHYGSGGYLQPIRYKPTEGVNILNIGSSYTRRWGSAQPPKEWIVKKLCNGIAEEIYKQIENGVFKIEDYETEMILRLKVEQ